MWLLIYHIVPTVRETEIKSKIVPKVLHHQMFFGVLFHSTFVYLLSIHFYVQTHTFSVLWQDVRFMDLAMVPLSLCDYFGGLNLVWPTQKSVHCHQPQCL